MRYLLIIDIIDDERTQHEKTECII
jgi:hypothetical protein